MVAGIWGNEALGGAYSLVMNGGYEVNPNLTKLPKLSDPNSDTASRTIMIKVRSSPTPVVEAETSQVTNSTHIDTNPNIDQNAKVTSARPRRAEINPGITSTMPPY